MSIANQSSDHASLSRQHSKIVSSHLRAILGSRAFIRSPRASEFLTLVVRNAIVGRHGNLHERMIGVELFGRAIDYDTGSDSVVRVAASEVRKRLNQFYLESAQADWPVRFDLPSGSYIPLFIFAEPKVEQSGELEGNGLQAPKSVSEPTHRRRKSRQRRDRRLQQWKTRRAVSVSGLQLF